MVTDVNDFLLSIGFIIIAIVLINRIGILFSKHKRKTELPEGYKKILMSRVHYYRDLGEEQKTEFELRLKRFLSDKKITGIETDVSDTDRLLVACSAIIPMFAFPYYKYPGVSEVLLYPNSFNEKFGTNSEAAGKNILGMVGDGFMNGKVILSKPNLEAAFDGMRHRENVGIHEFTHIIDKADGETNGVPRMLLENTFVQSWLDEIKHEMDKIKTGHSDIRPYALTNNAEFLAVVSEYFFDNPDKMKSRHPELYGYLSKMFKQDPE